MWGGLLAKVIYSANCSDTLNVCMGVLDVCGAAVGLHYIYTIQPIGLLYFANRGGLALLCPHPLLKGGRHQFRQ